MHVAFAAKDEATVDEFHRAAIAAGGRDNGKPGPRQGAENYYGAFVLDPDGNNIEAVAGEEVWTICCKWGQTPFLTRPPM